MASAVGKYCSPGGVKMTSAARSIISSLISMSRFLDELWVLVHHGLAVRPPLRPCVGAGVHPVGVERDVAGVHGVAAQQAPDGVSEGHQGRPGTVVPPATE